MKAGMRMEWLRSARPQTIATATLIDERGYARLRERAMQALKLSAAVNIMLFDTEMQVLMGATLPISTALPKVRHDPTPSVIATGQPAVSDYFVGEISKQPRTAVAVPVLRDDKVAGRPLGLVLANVIGRSIAEPIQALVAPALAIGRGETARAMSPAAGGTCCS